MSTISISIPDSLKKRVEHFAHADGVPVSEFIATVLSQRIAVADADSYIDKRAAKGSAEMMLQMLDKAPDVTPDAEDRLISHK